MAEKTTTMEKLFVQIFERKRWIIDQVQHQSHLFDQHLASTLLIDGIPPPPWLLPQPYPAESKKEELISGLLFPFPQAPAPYSSSRHSVNHQSIFTADTELLRGLYGDAWAIRGKPETRGETSVLPEVVSAQECTSAGAPHPILSPLAHECVLNDAPEPIPTPINIVKSSEEQSEPEVPDTYRSLEQSLARIQRSRPRQKDLELRNSVKACRSSLHDERRAAVDPSTVMDSGNACPLIGHVDDMELVRPASTDCKVCAVEEHQTVDWRSEDECCRTSSIGAETVVSGLRPLCVDESVKCESSHSIGEKFDAQVSESSIKSNNKASGVVQSSSVSDNAGRSQRKERDNSIYSTQPYCEIEFPKLAGSSAIDGEAKISIEEAIHVNSSEKLKESSGMQEAETEPCQIPEKLDSGGPSRLPESGDIGSPKVDHTGGILMQLQQVDAISRHAIQPPNPGILFPSIKRPISTAFHRLTSGKLLTNADPQDVLSGNRDDADSNSHGTNAEKMRVISDKLSESLSTYIQSDLYNNQKNQAKVLVSRSSADRTVHVEPKQLDFDGVGGQKNSLNEMEGTALEEIVQEEVPASGQSKSLDQENENGQCNFVSTQACVQETGDGSRIGISDATVLVCDASEEGKSLGSNFSLERETDKGRFSVLQNRITLSFDGENALECPLNVEQGSSLSCLKSTEKLGLSADRITNQLDLAKMSKLDSHQCKLEYGACVCPKVSAEVRVRELAGSSMCSHLDLILTDNAADIHGNEPPSTGDMVVDNPACRSDDPVENSLSGQLDAVGSKSEEHHMSGNSSWLGEKLWPHSGSSWPHSRQGGVGASQSEPPIASPASSLRSSRKDSPHRIMNGAKSHQMDVPSPKEFITAHDGDPVCPNASCNPVDSDYHNLDDYAIEGFRFSPMQQDREGDPGPSLDTGILKQNAAVPQVSLSGKTEVTGPSGYVLDQRGMSIEEVKDHQHPEDHFNFGDAEQSASSEGPVDGKLSHLEESYELSSHLACSPLPRVELNDADQMMPALEGCTMQAGDEELCLPKGESSFEKFDLRDSIVERACIIEQLCKSTCLDTPSTYLSTSDKLQKGSDLYQSLPNGLLEYIDLKNSYPVDDDTIGLFNGGFFKKEIGHALDGRSFSDCLPLSGSGNGRKPYSSPVGKLWEKIASSSGSSKKKASLNPELPCINEEIEIADEITGTSGKDVSLAVITSSAKRKPLDDITEDPNLHASVSELENHRCSLESVNTEVSFSGTNKRSRQKVGTHRMSKNRPTNKMRDSKPVPRHARITKIPAEPPHDSVSKRYMGLQKDGLGILEKEAKRGNIVCNVNSFIPLVQQKQAAVPVTGKRDVKVKALEAAEAARRQAEKREVERKKKKEALQLERARVEQENRRQLELQIKKKEEEKKKKEAEIAARKRSREEEEKREKERKRKRVEDARRQQEEQKEKLRLKKDEKGTKAKATIADEKKNADPKKSEHDVAVPQSLHAVLESGSLGPETPRDCPDNSKVTSLFSEGTDAAVVGDIQEQSYDISPYQCSDDEDEDADEDEPKKFMPSWASKNRIAQAIASQHKVDPDLILPLDSFCSIDEVVLPRSLELR